MKRNIILSTLAAALLGTAALPMQAQGIYVNKKNGESISYPKAILDKVTPEVFSDAQATKERGVVTTLQYERIADMNTPRTFHQIFPSGNSFVVVGGRSTDESFYPERPTSAEIYQNGQWKTINMNNTHDYGFSVVLKDGRVMIGGGNVGGDEVNSKKTEFYNPATQTFTPGPDMTTGRSGCSAVAIGNTVYVKGNWYADDKTFDYFDGSSFSAVGETYERFCPSIYATETGNIWTWGIYDNYGANASFYQLDNGNDAFLFNRYFPATKESQDNYFEYLATYLPMPKNCYLRVSDSYGTDDNQNGYFFLTRSSAGDYKLAFAFEDGNNIKVWTYNLVIPTVFPNTQETIAYKGDVFVNNDKKEIYLIGYCNTDSDYKLCLLSFNFTQGYWTIARAGGFGYSITTASWTMLHDGRLACTGGSDGDVAVKNAYIITPPVAGLTSSAEGKGVNVWKTDGTYDSYSESELESITTYEEEFDERIAHEIPVEYLSKMSAYMPIYSGSTPPIIEGIFKLTPWVVVFDESGYEPGHEFSDKIIRLSSQDKTNNTLRYEQKQADSYGVSDNVVILGQGNNFTMFFIQNITGSDYTTKNASIYSGTITNEGLKNLYFGFTILEKNDPQNTQIEVGKIRIIKDADGLSELSTWNARLKGAQGVHSLQAEDTAPPSRSVSQRKNPNGKVIFKDQVIR